MLLADAVTFTRTLVGAASCSSASSHGLTYVQFRLTSSSLHLKALDLNPQ